MSLSRSILNEMARSLEEQNFMPCLILSITCLIHYRPNYLIAGIFHEGNFFAKACTHNIIMNDLFLTGR